MPEPTPKEKIIQVIKDLAVKLGRTPSKSEAKKAGVSEYHIYREFKGYREAVREAGLEPDMKNARIGDDELLIDWGKLARRLERAPTTLEYGREGRWDVSGFRKRFGGWSNVLRRFHDWAATKPEWADVLSRLVPTPPQPEPKAKPRVSHSNASASENHSLMADRPTYGDPIDFRGLRHEPVNEQGVVFLFGMVARELGYMVEAVQSGFPDCEAKRKIPGGKWQRVRIEFEFESRNYRNHGHPEDGADVLVCWRHNWTECPGTIEVVQLSTVIKELSK